MTNESWNEFEAWLNEADEPQEAEAENQQGMFPNIPLTANEQMEIVSFCNQFKLAVRTHAREKKNTMRTCYAYSKSKFVGGDLLPVPSTMGGDRDMDEDRPRVFIPLVRQQLKQIYSYLKLTIFPNDEDYFRVRGKTPEAARIEDSLTEGLKSIFKQAMITEKLGSALYNVIWAGNAVVFPTIKEEIFWEWHFDAAQQQYVAVQVDMPPLPDLETWNPIDFYIDPTEKDLERVKWGYFGTKKLQELLDSQLYFNKEPMQAFASKETRKNDQNDGADLSQFNGLNPSFEDAEKNVDYDLYYFPYIKTSDREYRNMIVGIVGQQVLVRFHPNLFPRGMNPAVFFNWLSDVDSGYGTGPIEDIKELQRLTNIMHNYMIEVLARIGNRFVVTPDVDLTNLFGVAGGVAVAERPDSIQPLTGNYAEIGELYNVIGTIKAEAQITSGSQNPFQGSANVDFKKTATELQILQENSISIIREVVEHLSVMGIQRILERLMYLCAELYSRPTTVRVNHPQLGTQFMNVDLSVLRSGLFTIELVSVNSSQSKSAQVNGLMQLLQLVGQSPELFTVAEPVIQKIGELQGITDISQMIEDIKERIRMNNASRQQGIPGSAMGMGAVPGQTMAGIPQAPPGAQGHPGQPGQHLQMG